MTARVWAVWLLVAGACAGAALALPLVTIEQTWHVLLAVIIGVLLATVLTGPEKAPEAAAEPVSRPARLGVTRPEPARPMPPGNADTARLVLDADQPAAGGGQWWNQANPLPQSTSNGKKPSTPARARELTGYIENARVVQCPRCGSFHIDVTRLAGGYSFRCRTDQHAWQWQPGRAWPGAVVVSRRRIP